MSEQKFKEAKGNLAFSQQLVDRLHAAQQPQMAQPQTAQPQPAPAAQAASPTSPQQQAATQEPETPQEDKREPAEEPKTSGTADEVLSSIEEVITADKQEEEKRMQDMEAQHEGELKTIKDRVLSLLKRGKKK